MRSKADKIRLFEDIAKMAGGAMNSMGDVRSQVKSVVRTFLGEMDLVTREEFERVEALAQKARERQLELEKRIAALEKPTKKKSAPAKKKAPAKAKAPARKKR